MANLNDEIFIYIGKKPNVHFFFHMQLNQMSDDEIILMSADVYNTMVHETMIQENDNVVVFNITPEKNIATCTFNENFPYVVFLSGQLEEAFIECCGANRSNDKTIFVIKAKIRDQKAVKFETYEIPFDEKIFMPLKEMINIKNIKFGEIEYCTSLKPITYL